VHEVLDKVEVGRCEVPARCRH